VVGVPLMVMAPPLFEDSESPAGSDPTVIAHAYGAIPPDPLQTAVKVIPSVAGPVAGLQLILKPLGGEGPVLLEIVPLNDWVACCAGVPPSVTRTVNAYGPAAVAGPLIVIVLPVVPLRVSPAGSAPALIDQL
jgi:hypothetical protein